MKPPVCEVCGQRFAPADGELVSFVADAATDAFDERAKTPGVVGHRPNTGWFCSDHAEAARGFSEALTLPEALAQMVPDQLLATRSSVAASPSGQGAAPADPWPVAASTASAMRRCASCGEEFFERAGGSVTFFEEYSVKVQRSILPGEAKFAKPSRRWFCLAHAIPAMKIAGAVAIADARSLLCPDGRGPLAFDEVPPGVPIGSVDERGEPMIMPLLPLPSASLTGAPERVVAVSGRPGRDSHKLLASFNSALADALGIEHLRWAGSTSANPNDPEELRLVPEGLTFRGTVGMSLGRHVGLFTTRGRHQVDDVVLGEHVRLVMQDAGRSVLEITVVASANSEKARDGSVMLDELCIRVADDAAERVDSVVDRIVAAFGEPVDDPFDLRPDLVGVDRRGAEIKRGHLSTSSWLEWSLRPIPVERVMEIFLASIPILCAAHDDTQPSDIERSTERSWSPMDGAQPPHCPFSDTIRHEASFGDGEIVVSSTKAQWSENDVSNVSASLLIHTESVRISVSASGRGKGGTCASVSIARPTSSAVIEIVADAFDEHLG